MLHVSIKSIIDFFRSILAKFFNIFLAIWKALLYNDNILVQEKKTTSAVNEIRFDFLDGFRGLCAFTVIVGHSNGLSRNINYNNTLFQHMNAGGALVQSIAMPGFFLLSSFLLTFRLMNDLLQVDALAKNYNVLKIISKYFIRRFFRIYLPFVFYCTCIKYSPKMLGIIFPYHISDWFKLVSLTFDISDPNHLWTIPLEINYYFFIPLICLTYLLVYKTSKKLLYAFLTFCIYMSYFHLEHNLFYYFPKNPFVFDPYNVRAPTFSVFLCGSLLAFTYLTYENELLPKRACKWLISSRIFQILLNLPTISLILYCFRSEYLRADEAGEYRYMYWYKGAFVWSIVILLLLLSSNEFSIGRMFFNIKLMKNFGIYSYGIYLWHPTAIKMTERLNFDHKFINAKNAYEYFFVIALLSYLLGYFFYVFFEKSMIRIATYLCQSSYLRISKNDNSLPH
jgi:peptidoglycan/LPS O-acetylase OafA/YrhL